MPRTPLTKADRDRAIAYHDLATTMRELEADLRWGLNDSLRIPREWTEILQGPMIPKKRRVTLRLDEDVERFFRAMGMGHLTRMNAVLRSFMLARLSGVVSGPEEVGYRPTPEEEERSLRREILDRVGAEMDARDRAEADASEGAKRRARIAALKKLREERAGKG